MWKEAMRLTDVERLIPWDNTIHGIALRKVVDDLIVEMNELCDGIESHDNEVIDDVWIVQTVMDLTEARDKPDAFLTRMSAARRSGRT